MAKNEFTEEALRRGLGLKEATSLVVGTVIGTGVFLKASVMTQAVGGAFWVFAAWIGAGILSLSGAFVFAELASRFPRAGGEYVFLREAYGGLPAFLNGWMRFLIGNPGSIAAYAAGFVAFLNGSFHFSPFAQSALAVGLIAVFTLLNCATVHAAGLLQACMTAVKVSMILGLTAVIFAAAPKEQIHFAGWASGGWPGFKAFGSAMLAALWAYDGWNGMPMAAGEVKDPSRNIPRALVAGMFTIIAIYLFVNLVFFFILPLDAIRSSFSYDFPEALPVFTKAAAVSLGPEVIILVSLLLAFSALVALNGSVLSGARVPFAMARDGVLFSALGKVSHRTHAPVVAVLVQGMIAALLALSGSFDQLTDYVVFASWIFYALAVFALFIFRRRDPHSGYHMPFYPWLPLLFLGSAFWLIVNTLITEPVQSLIGLALILAGVPVYYWYRRGHSKRR